MEKTSIGKILRKRREDLALTQRDVANHVGVTESAVSRWESGNIDNMRRDKIANLAEVLQVSPLLIMGAEEFVDKPPTLSFEQAALLSDFDSMNPEGQKMALGIIKSLRVAHPKDKERVARKRAEVKNNFTNSGEVKNNFVAYGGRNSVNQNVNRGG